MVKAGGRLPQHPVDAALRRQGLVKIIPPHHIGDTEGQLVDHSGQLIGDKPIRPAQNHITTALRILGWDPEPPARKPLVLPAPAMTGGTTRAGVTPQARQITA